MHRRLRIHHDTRGTAEGIMLTDGMIIVRWPGSDNARRAELWERLHTASDAVWGRT